MAPTDSMGSSSPLSSIPDSDGLSLPPMSQETPQEAAGPASQTVQNTVIPDVEPEETTMSSSRPKRTRAAPPLKKETPKKVAKRTPKKKKTWDADSLLTDPKSPLAMADLRSLLCNPVAWDILTPSDKQEILALLPSESQLISATSQEARPDFAALKNDDTFRHDCTTYTENLAQGRFESDWLESAWAAHQRRKMGDFDEFLCRRFEEVWETELPEEMKPKRHEDVRKIGDVAGTEKDNEAWSSVRENEGLEGDGEEKATRNEPKNEVVAKGTRKLGDELPAETPRHDQDEQSTGKHEHKTQPSTAEDEPNDHESVSKTSIRNHDDLMVIDELQERSSQQEDTRRASLVQRPNTKMEVDGEESADELA